MKYNFNVPLGSGIPYAPSRKCEGESNGVFSGMVSGLASGASSLLGNLLGSLWNKKNAKDLMNHSWNLQRAQQEWLSNTQYGKMVSGMKNAGLNPATANGTTPATPPVGSPSAPDVSSSLGSDAVSSYLNARNVEKDLEIKDKQKGLIDAQTHVAEQEAEGKRIENQSLGDIKNAFLEQLKSLAAKQFGEGALAQQKVKESEELVKNLQTENDKLKEEIENLKSTRNLTDAQTLFTNKQANTWDGMARSIVFKNTAEGNLANGRNGREGQMILFDMINSAALSDMYDSSTDLNRVNTKLGNIKKQWDEFLMNQDMKWNERNQWINAGCQIVNTAANAFGQFMPTKISTSSFGYTPLGNFESFTSQTRRRF